MSYLFGRFLYEGIAAVTKIIAFVLGFLVVLALSFVAVMILLPLVVGVALFRKKDANNGDASD